MVLSGSNSLLLPDPEVLRCLLILALGMQMVEGSCVPVSSQQDTHKWLRYSCDSVMLKQILAQRQHKVGNDQLGWGWDGVGQPRFYRGQKTSCMESSILTRHSGHLRWEKYAQSGSEQWYRRCICSIAGYNIGHPVKSGFQRNNKLCVSISISYAILRTYLY